MGNDSSETIPSAYDPPVVRYKWFRRWAGATLLAAAVLLGFRLLLGWKLGREMAALEKQVRDAGGAWTEAELDARPPLLDSENAALIYLRAAGMYVEGQDCARNSGYDYDYDSEKPPLWYYLAAASDERYESMFKLAATARNLPEANWSKPGGASGIGVPLPRLCVLANELADTLQWRHHLGEDVVAIDRFRVILHLAHSLRQGGPHVEQFLADGIDAVAFSALMEIAPGLRVEDDRVNREVRSLLAELERLDREINDYSRRALWMQVRTVRHLNDVFADRTWLSRPVLRRSFVSIATVSVNDHTHGRPHVHQPLAAYVGLHGTRGFGQPDLSPAASLIYRGKQVALLPSTSLPLDDFPYGYNDRRLEMLWRLNLECRFLRVALAVRLFVNDRGVFPATLDELVPAYLPAVPATPGFEDKPLQIVRFKGAHRDRSDRIVLFADRSSAQNALPPYRSYDWCVFRPDGGTYTESGRQWRDVAKWPATAFPPATDTWHNQPTESPSSRREPGFEASGLAPSAHSPAVKSPSDEGEPTF